MSIGGIGRRLGGVGSALGAIAWDPDEHPRDAEGQFTDKPGVVLPDGTSGTAVSQVGNRVKVDTPDGVVDADADTLRTQDDPKIAALRSPSAYAARWQQYKQAATKAHMGQMSWDDVNAIADELMAAAHPGGFTGEGTRKSDGKPYGSGYSNPHDPRREPWYDEYVEDLETRLNSVLHPSPPDPHAKYDQWDSQQKYVTHTRDGKVRIDRDTGRPVYRAARERLHQQIIQAVLDDAAARGVPRDRKALFMAGPSGAGKSTAIVTRGAEFGVVPGTKADGTPDPDNPANYVVLNPDNVKETMIRMGMMDDDLRAGLSPDEAVSVIHEESSDITKEIRTALWREGYNVLIDGTFCATRSKPDKKRKEVLEYVSHGYTCSGVLIDGTIDNSYVGAGRRHRQAPRNPGGRLSGRYIPYVTLDAQQAQHPDTVSEHTGHPFRSYNAETFEDSMDLFGDQAWIFDVEGTSATLVWPRPEGAGTKWLPGGEVKAGGADRNRGGAESGAEPALALTTEAVLAGAAHDPAVLSDVELLRVAAAAWAGGESAADVLAERDGLHVVGAAAKAHPAQVVDRQAIADGADEFGVDVPVYLYGPAADADQAVTGVVVAAGPQPAGVRLIDAGEDSVKALRLIRQVGVIPATPVAGGTEPPSVKGLVATTVRADAAADAPRAAFALVAGGAQTAGLDGAVAVIGGAGHVDILLEGKAGGLDRNRGGASRLRAYWTHGEGAAKIGWGTPGDWTRCVALVSKHMGPRAKGYCALRHREVTGMYPGDKHNKALPFVDGLIEVKAEQPPQDAPDMVMVAFYLPAAAALDLEGGSDRGAADLHLTLAVLDEPASALDEQRRAALLDLVEGFAAESLDIDGILNGAGVLNTPDGPVSVLLFDGPDMPGFHGDLVDALTDAGFVLSADHGFLPHVTVGTGPQPPKPPNMPLVFDTVSVAIGADVYDFPLAGDDEEAEPEPEPEPEEAEAEPESEPEQEEEADMEQKGRPLIDVLADFGVTDAQGAHEEKRDFSRSERDDAASSGHALPDADGA